MATLESHHINYHGSLENYFEAKAKMFKNPKFAVFNAKDEKINDFAKNYKGEKFYFDDESYKNSSYIKNNAIYFKQNDIEEKIVELNDIKLVGHHNLQNVMCSIIVAKLRSNNGCIAVIYRQKGNFACWGT